MSFINGICGACYPWWSLVICLLVGAALMLAFWLYLCRWAMRGYFSEGKEVNKMNWTTVFNVLAFIVAVAAPILGGAGYTGEVPVEWGVFVPAAIALVNMILKWYKNKYPASRV
jgi:formate-dependent nitrite reductase membrane component NrfD